MDCSLLTTERGGLVKESAATLCAIARAVLEYLFPKFVSPSPPLVCPASLTPFLAPPLLRLRQALLKLSVTKQYTTGSRQLFRLLRVTVM